MFVQTADGRFVQYPPENYPLPYPDRPLNRVAMPWMLRDAIGECLSAEQEHRTAFDWTVPAKTAARRIDGYIKSRACKKPLDEDVRAVLGRGNVNALIETYRLIRTHNPPPPMV
jgi:hypothetical protein